MLGWKVLCVVGALILVLSPSTKGYPIEELKKEADRLRVLYELALQQEVQSENEPNQGRERLYAQHERVKSYKDYTPEERKQAELEHIMEIARIMGKDIPKEEPPTKNSETGTSSNTLCHVNGTNDTVTYGDLREMIDAMYRVFELEFFTNKHYVASDYGLYRVVDSNQEDALHVFFNNFQNLPLPSKLWMTNTPCISCSQIIMSTYNRNANKPSLFVANVTAGVSLNQTVESFKCLARMVHEGFTVSVWDWGDFRDNLSTQVCQDAIKTAVETPEFEAAKNGTENLLEYIRHTSTSSQIMSWCPF